MQSVRNLFRGPWSSSAQLDGKTVVITGANTGIGKETARDLAKREILGESQCQEGKDRTCGLCKTGLADLPSKTELGAQWIMGLVLLGARVIMACRDMEKGEAAMKEIMQDSGNQDIVLVKLDLSDTKSIREFAELINKEEKRVNILINNAGIMMCPYSKTVDGFELQFGVNHLGHFLLTYLLIDLIKKSTPARIINVSSMAHTWGDIRLDDINSEKSYDSRKAYGQSKLANILCTRTLAKKLEGTGVTTYALHPGVVHSDLWRHLSAPLQLGVKMIRPFTKTTVQGAQTSIYCAVAPELEKETGGYYSDCAPASCSQPARDDEMAQKLWELSCQMLGITWD